MPRYNTVVTSAVTATTATFSSPTAGLLTTLTGTPGYTVTLAAPASFAGTAQTFFNNTGGSVTLSTPSGVCRGPGFTAAASQIIPNQASYTLTSDGTDYIIVNNEGGPQLATSLTTTGTLTAQGTVSLTPASANITISPTGTGTVTIAPATAGSINNVTIGNSTAANGTFNTLTVNTSLTGSGTIDGGSF